MVFMARKGDQSDIYNLYCIKDGEISKYGVADSGCLKTSKKMRKYFQGENGNLRDNINVSCTYNSSLEKWTPLEMTTNPIDNYSSIQNMIV